MTMYFIDRKKDNDLQNTKVQGIKYLTNYTGLARLDGRWDPGFSRTGGSPSSAAPPWSSCCPGWDTS